MAGRQSLYVRIELAAMLDPNCEIKHVLGDIMQNLRELQRGISSRLYSLVAAAFITELVFASRIESFSAFGVSISDLSVIQRLAPIVVAYLLFSIGTLQSSKRMLEAMYEIGFRRAYPALSAGGLERLLTPPDALQLYGLIRAHVGGARNIIVGSAGITAALAMVLVPPAYVIWTMGRCVARFGATDPLTALSCAVSLVLLFQSWLLIVATVEAVGGPDRR